MVLSVCYGVSLSSQVYTIHNSHQTCFRSLYKTDATRFGFNFLGHPPGRQKGEVLVGKRGLHRGLSEIKGHLEELSPHGLRRNKKRQDPLPYGRGEKAAPVIDCSRERELVQESTGRYVSPSRYFYHPLDHSLFFHSLLLVVDGVRDRGRCLDGRFNSFVCGWED